MTNFPRLLRRSEGSRRPQGVAGARVLYASDLAEGRGENARGWEWTGLCKRCPQTRQLFVLGSYRNTQMGLAFSDFCYWRGENAATAHMKSPEAPVSRAALLHEVIPGPSFPSSCH
ncbi:uncharacterized protein V5649_005389 isoform 2-T2 [Rhynchonycteris naso]